MSVLCSASLHDPVFPHPWVPIGKAHAEGCYLPLCPHQVLWGPRKLWGLTHTLTPSAAYNLGPRCPELGLPT